MFSSRFLMFIVLAMSLHRIPAASFEVRCGLDNLFSNSDHTARSELNSVAVLCLVEIFVGLFAMVLNLSNMSFIRLLEKLPSTLSEVHLFELLIFSCQSLYSLRHLYRCCYTKSWYKMTVDLPPSALFICSIVWRKIFWSSTYYLTMNFCVFYVDNAFFFLTLVHKNRLLGGIQFTCLELFQKSSEGLFRFKRSSITLSSQVFLDFTEIRSTSKLREKREAIRKTYWSRHFLQKCPAGLQRKHMGFCGIHRAERYQLQIVPTLTHSRSISQSTEFEFKLQALLRKIPKVSVSYRRQSVPLGLFSFRRILL